MKLLRRRRRLDWILIGGLVTLVGVLSWGTFRRVRQDNLDQALIDVSRRRGVGHYEKAVDLIRTGANPNAVMDNSRPLGRTFADQIKALFQRHSRKDQVSALQLAVGSDQT